MTELFSSVADVDRRLRDTGYIPTCALSTTVFLASRLGKPILAEGPAGVGKTELAKAIASALDTRVVRLQCYEGLDEAKTLYEWKYAKQLLYAQMLRDRIDSIVENATTLSDAVDRLAAHEDVFFSRRFLHPRPLLEAIQSVEPVVLLIDEIDRAEEELEALLLETLAEEQISIPELGTISASSRPMVVLTSNNVRDLSDALRRRCLHLSMTFPPAAVEAEIITSRLPGISQALAHQLAGFVARLRKLQLKKQPSIAETLDWAESLLVLGADDLDEELLRATMNLLVKHRGDLDLTTTNLAALLRA